MKKQIVITEEDGQIEIKKFTSDSKGKFEEVEEFDDMMELHRIVHRAVYQDKRNMIKRKKSGS